MSLLQDGTTGRQRPVPGVLMLVALILVLVVAAIL